MTALSLYWLSHKPQARDERSNVYSLTAAAIAKLPTYVWHSMPFLGLIERTATGRLMVTDVEEVLMD